MNKRKNTRTLSRYIPLPMLAAAAMLLPSLSHATPYATELNVTGTTVSFTINESGSSVAVIYGTTTNNLGTLAKGSYTNNFPGLTGTVYVQASKSGGLGWQTGGGSNVTHKVNEVVITENWAGRNLISTDTNSFNRYNSPRGVAVNKNPASPYFGRVYVDNSTPGSAGSPARGVGRGFYTLKADLSDSPLNYGTNAQLGTVWSNGASASAPYLIAMGDDGYIYVSDFADASSIMGRVNPTLTVAERVLDFEKGPSALAFPTNHGSTKKVFSTGSMAGGNLKLYTLDEDYQGNCSSTFPSPKNSIWRYDIDSGPLTNQGCGTLVGTPSPGWTTTGTEDFTIGTNGYVYAIQNRSVPNIEPGLYVLQLSDGANVYNSRDGYRALTGINTDNDILSSIQSIAISGDNKWLAINTIAISSNAVAPATGSDCWIIPLTNGIPDLAGRLLLDSGAVSQGRQVEFDIANNLYTVSSGDAILRVFSPGGFTVTTSGSDGSFNAFTAPTTVSVAATVPQASQTGPTSGVFTLTRVGPTTNTLSVDFVLGGTATNGVYTVSPAGITPAATNSITFAANQSTTNITITPVVDTIPRPTMTVILSPIGGPLYGVGTPSSATVSIQNTATPGIVVTNVDTQMYERTNDYARFRITRWGDTNADLTTGAGQAVNISFGGTAVAGSDFYYDSLTVDMPPGLVTTNIKVYPIHNGLVTGPKTVTATAATGTGYNPVSPASTGTITIVDSDLAPETVLWSDNFDSDTSANWTYYFASTNGVDDFRINKSDGQGVGTWPYDYFANLSIPPAPHSTNGTTTGLYMSVNKDDLSPVAAALNFYPNGQSFSNNFALRFDMFLIKNDTSGQTEYAVYGINHSGTRTNWFRNSGGGVGTNWLFDGIFYGEEADGAALGDYAAFSSPVTNSNPTALPFGPAVGGGRLASTLTAEFKSPPYTVAGAPANTYGSTNPTWADVEVSQVNGVITWKINQTEIFSFTNSTAYTNGNIMLGYCDAFDSTGVSGAAIIYDNVRVVSIAAAAPAAPITITKITSAGSNVTIDFTAGASDTTASFTVQSSSSVISGFSDLATTITSPSSGNFSTTFSKSGPLQFYRIRRLP